MTPPKKSEAMFVRIPVPLPTEAVSKIRKHMEAFGELLDGVRSLVEAGNALGDRLADAAKDVDKDIRQATRKRRRKRA